MEEEDDDSDEDPLDDDDSEEGTRRKPGLSLGALLEILAQPERRDLLSYLTDSSEEVATTDELVADIVQEETERDKLPDLRTVIQQSLGRNRPTCDGRTISLHGTIQAEV